MAVVFRVARCVQDATDSKQGLAEIEHHRVPASCTQCGFDDEYSYDLVPGTTQILRTFVNLVRLALAASVAITSIATGATIGRTISV